MKTEENNFIEYSMFYFETNPHLDFDKAFAQFDIKQNQAFN
jgi:hypothetical protein